MCQISEIDLAEKKAKKKKQNAVRQTRFLEKRRAAGHKWTSILLTGEAQKKLTSLLASSPNENQSSLINKAILAYSIGPSISVQPAQIEKLSKQPCPVYEETFWKGIHSEWSKLTELERLTEARALITLFNGTYKEEDTLEGLEAIAQSIIG